MLHFFLHFFDLKNRKQKNKLITIFWTSIFFLKKSTSLGKGGGGGTLNGANEKNKIHYYFTNHNKKNLKLFGFPLILQKKALKKWEK